MNPWLAFSIILLAGCMEASTEGPPVFGPRASMCDYEFDDYRGGQPRLMVHWDVPGEPVHPPSGREAFVQLRLDDAAVANNRTTTDCLLFIMDDDDADRVTVRVRDGECWMLGSTDHEYTGAFDTVRVDLTGGECAN